MSKANMIKMFNKLAYRHSQYEVYSDFIELSALSINTLAQPVNKDKNDKRYFEIMKKYTKDEFEIFPKLLGELVLTLEEKQTDVLGELFMEMELGNKNKGQFFTPYSICLLTCECSIDGIDEVINKKGYVTLNEPCVGGGAMILAFAEVMRKKGFNPQRQLKVICQDLDIRSVYMTYVQLSLVGIPAMVCHMNTISLEMYSEWKTPFWVLGGWRLKREVS